MNIVEMCELYSTLYLKSILPLYCGCKSLALYYVFLIFIFLLCMFLNSSFQLLTHRVVFILKVELYKIIQKTEFACLNNLYYIIF